HAFRPRLCFIQVSTDTDLFLFDTLSSEVRPGFLTDLFADETRAKFFHAAGGDLQYLAQAGVRVRGLFDTHRAATLLGWPKVGLADLVAERLGVTLDKAHQQSDFSLRPLPPEMRRYIADDVRYLTELGRLVSAAVVAADIVEEVQLDCERLTDEAVARPQVAPFAMKIPRTLPPAAPALPPAATPGAPGAAAAPGGGGGHPQGAEAPHRRHPGAGAPPAEGPPLAVPDPRSAGAGGAGAR